MSSVWLCVISCARPAHCLSILCSKPFTLDIRTFFNQIHLCLPYLQVPFTSTVLCHLTFLKVIRSTESRTFWVRFLFHLLTNQDESWCGVEAIQVEHLNVLQGEVIAALHWHTFRYSWANFSADLFVFILVWVTLTFIQGHSGTRRQKLLDQLSHKVLCWFLWKLVSCWDILVCWNSFLCYLVQCVFKRENFMEVISFKKKTKKETKQPLACVQTFSNLVWW